MILKKGSEQKYFGVLGPSAGKIILLIFYRASHMVLKAADNFITHVNCQNY